MTQAEYINLKFSSIAEQIEHFANLHNIEIGKCLRGNMGWEMTRPHADGGSINLLNPTASNWIPRPQCLVYLVESGYIPATATSACGWEAGG